MAESPRQTESVGQGFLGRKILAPRAPKKPSENPFSAVSLSALQHQQSHPSDSSPQSNSKQNAASTSHQIGGGPEPEDMMEDSSRPGSNNDTPSLRSVSPSSTMPTVDSSTDDDQPHHSLRRGVFPYNRKLAPKLDEFSWLDDWDVTIFRCEVCRRPFPTSQTLYQHRMEFHSVVADKMETMTLPYFCGISDDKKLRADHTEVLSEGGDLLLEVQKHQIRRVQDLPTSTYIPRGVQYFQVSSQVLANASPVFNGMFGSNSRFKERSRVLRGGLLGNAPAVIRLEDDPQVLRIILLALHWKIDKLPETIDFSDCVKMAVVADKYQLQKPLKLFVDKWINKFGFREDKKDDNIHHDWLLVAWIFDYPKQFAAVTQQLTKKCIVHEGLLCVPGPPSGPGIIPLHPNVPSCVIEKLAAKRLECINRLRSYLTTEKNKRSTSTETPLCKGSTPTSDCDALQLAHFLVVLKAHSLESSTFWSKSFNAISDKLLELSSPIIPASLGATTEADCKSCTEPFSVEEEALQSALPSCCNTCKEKERQRRREERDTHTCYKGHQNSCSWIPGLQWAVRCGLRSEDRLELSEFPDYRKADMGYQGRPPVAVERNSLGHKRRAPGGKGSHADEEYL